LKDLARLIFGHAQVYEKACRVLNAAGAQEPSLLLPSSVNAALSLELYFKSLNIIEHGVEFKIKGRHSHHFGQLFQELSDETKTNLNERFKVAVSNMDPNEIAHLESAIGGVIPKDLKSNLIEWAAIFTELRYAQSFIEKNKGKRVAMAFYPQIVESVFGHITEREPSWVS
jgi:hypothetical protein